MATDRMHAFNRRDWELSKSAVERLIVRCRIIPREILLHCSPLDLMPGALVTVENARLVNRVANGLTVNVIENKTGRAV